MPKKRRTRQQKKILKLKRELVKTRKKKETLSSKNRKNYKKSKLSKKAVTNKSLEKEKLRYQPEYDEGLIKKDLLKTLVISFSLLALISLLYLYSGNLLSLL